MRTYIVVRFDASQNIHICNDESGNQVRVDLMVNGDLEKYTNPEDLVGRTFEAEYDWPYISIAMNVREKKEINE